jgi:hypothetical protein
MSELEKQVERMQERLSAGVLHDTPGSGDGQDNPPAPVDAPGGVPGGCSRQEQDVRERLIKEYYRQRIDQLFTQLQMADSKALHFEAEVSKVVFVLCK